ncbi:hypothetical protein [Anaeromyxobacter diazotrophicus]|uniref:Uncharacterized protein n=1 Tax=Anaeromyxobacter diazotrophicus TaxID=2590199 RepID=A0A7I9VKB1_9BACT|nr:hypothetical protein [Anaeromyxobacter diazotrophicus]GEJ56628.1 hypothetical protein AMYX_13690 [Anaeromyxobacter diazotrophicus]
MPPTEEVVAGIVARRPFAVLGYSAEDAVWCPACLRSAAGLSPGRPDGSGKPIVPLFARDATVREEVCENCERSLCELLAAGHGASAPKPVTAHTRVYAARTALSFDRVPPIEVRTELKTTEWRWDPRFRVWWSIEERPRIPASVVLPPPTPPAPAARPPIVRKRR